MENKEKDLVGENTDKGQKKKEKEEEKWADKGKRNSDGSGKAHNNVKS